MHDSLADTTHQQDVCGVSLQIYECRLLGQTIYKQNLKKQTDAIVSITQ